MDRLAEEVSASVRSAQHFRTQTSRSLVTMENENVLQSEREHRICHSGDPPFSIRIHASCSMMRMAAVAGDIRMRKNG